MSDKLGQTLDELIKKDKDSKKSQNKGRGGKKPQNKGRQMTKKLSSKHAPSARDKARILRKDKVRRFGRDDDRRPARNNKVLVSRSRRLREEAEKEETKQTKQSTKLKVLNLNRSITNEDLNELFNHIGPLTE